MQPDLEPIRTAEIDWQQSQPFAPVFGDGYFSRAGGADESRAVFIEGNHLAARFASLPAEGLFIIGETGFGTGLNLLLAADCFRRHAPPSARLALVSAELHPLPHKDLERALAALAIPTDLAARLIAQYPSPTPGFHRLRLADNIDLTLMLGDALEMWRRQPVSVDAWLLDGFAPDRNPAMWQPALFELLAARSRPGTTLATFTVAGPVRRALAGAGFEFQKKPGFAGKRERLEGQLPGVWKAQRQKAGHALVVGAGLAGATTARALAERGWTVEVLERAGVAGNDFAAGGAGMASGACIASGAGIASGACIASGASGNRAGVVYTTPSGVATPQNRFYQSSYLHGLGWLERLGAQPETGCLNGVVQHIVNPRQRSKMESALASGHWPERELVRIDEDSVLLRRGGYLRPGAWCVKLLDHPRISLRRLDVERLRMDGILQAHDGQCESADAIIICTAAPLPGLPELTLRCIRGQVSEIRATRASSSWQRAECHAGYLTPAVDGIHCIGATFDLNDSDPTPRDADDLRNLAQLRRHLPKRWQALGGDQTEIVGRRVGFRWQARDYLPVVGALPGAQNRGHAQVLVNIGHGSRGITGTPICADLLADQMCGLPQPTDTRIISALAPMRFEGLTRSPGQPR